MRLKELVGEFKELVEAQENLEVTYELVNEEDDRSLKLNLKVN